MCHQKLRPTAWQLNNAPGLRSRVQFENVICFLPCRWRKLEGSDPTAYELIHKVQALQRRLLATLEAVASKDAALADKQALIAQLKSLLDRRPGPEAAAQLSASQVPLLGLVIFFNLHAWLGRVQRMWNVAHGMLVHGLG